jgi:hypothetical protein
VCFNRSPKNRGVVEPGGLNVERVRALLRGDTCPLQTSSALAVFQQWITVSSAPKDGGLGQAICVIGDQIRPISEN